MRSLRINGTNAHDIQVQNNADIYKRLRGVEWVHGLFLFPLVLGKM